MNKIYKIILSAFLVTALSLVFALATSLEGDLYASDSKDAIKADSPGRSHKIERYDKSSNFYYIQEGRASWYGRRFHNRKTASGEKYNMNALSVAHRNLPFGTILRVTNTDNNRVALVRVNDRGPFIKSKICDLSFNTAESLDAFDNPGIKLEALVSNDYFTVNWNDDEYYFGYSFDLPLVCLPSGVLKFLDSSEDFEEAVTIYRDYLSNFPDKMVYLMISANNKHFYLNSSENEVTYYVALYDGYSLQFADEAAH